MEEKIKISRIWSMPNKWTFKIKPIKELLRKYNVGQGWIDPFCGFNSPAEYKNDLNPNNKFAQYNLEALEFLNLKKWHISIKYLIYHILNTKKIPTMGILLPLRTFLVVSK